MYICTVQIDATGVNRAREYFTGLLPIRHRTVVPRDGEADGPEV